MQGIGMGGLWELDLAKNRSILLLARGRTPTHARKSTDIETHTHTQARTPTHAMCHRFLVVVKKCNRRLFLHLFTNRLLFNTLYILCIICITLSLVFPIFFSITNTKPHTITTTVRTKILLRRPSWIERGAKRKKCPRVNMQNGEKDKCSY